jgi:hypothetical protein
MSPEGGERRLTRADLAAPGVRPLQLGEPDKADLLLVPTPDGTVVVKDFAAKAWWVRWIGRLQIAREVRAYRALVSIPGIPRLVGQIDGLAVAIERIEGDPLGRAGDRARDGSEKLEQLRAILDRIHARGVAHWDLRARDNLLLNRAGRVFVLDFASAVRLRPGGLAHRLFFRFCRLIDESAYLKWKRLLDAGPYSAQEQRFVDRYRGLRTLWFHRGKAWRGKDRPRS